MQQLQCDEERFLKDTTDHQMEIIRDDGVHRHIRFSKPGTMVYHFDLITWPGHLCITGDCGTYVFSRIEDMFKFFRTDDNDFNKNREGGLSINTGYWGEKLLSIGTDAGYKEFDEDTFTNRVKEYFTEYWEGTPANDPARHECWEAVNSDVLSACDDGQHSAYDAVYRFSHGDFIFQDFFDGGGTERYTWHYLWNLYAIAWGITIYDKEAM